MIVSCLADKTYEICADSKQKQQELKKTTTKQARSSLSQDSSHFFFYPESCFHYYQVSIYPSLKNIYIYFLDLVWIAIMKLLPSVKIYSVKSKFK